MSTPQQLLDTVWQIFRSNGVADDLAVIEHIAAVLLAESQTRPYAGDPTPQPYAGSEIGPELHDIIRVTIREAMQAVDAPYEVLDPHALFRPAKFGGRGQYPTPRHVVRLMLRLASVDREHDLADFACGSGGFLAHRPHGEDGGQSVGVEIAGRWARIAYANTVLRLGTARAQVLHRNTLLTAKPGAELRDRRFNRVLMNPPFGDKVEAGLLKEVDLPELAGRSEVVLTTLALRALKGEGCAAVLLPAGPLFGNGTAETALRRRLLDDHHLRAVVALPRDAFQPYNGIQTYLLLAEQEYQEDGFSWFFQLGRDGYPAGQGRDLTERPGEPSDFPLLEVALGASPPPLLLDLGGHEDVLARAVFVPSDVEGTQATVGLVLEASLRATLQRVEWYSAATTLPDPVWSGPLLLVTLSFEASTRTVAVQFGNSPVTGISDLEAWQRGRSEAIERASEDAGEREADREGVRTIYDADSLPGGSETGGAVMVSDTGILMGRALPTRVVRGSQDPRPETYVRSAGPQEALKSSAALIGEIRTRQHELSKILDGLSDSAASIGRAAPRPDPFPDPASLRVFGTLSLDQDRVYREVLAWPHQTVEEGSGNAYQVPSPFTAANIVDRVKPPRGDEEEIAGVSGEVVVHTLSLLEAMGVIVRAHLPAPVGGDPVLYYRLATPWDEPMLDEPVSTRVGRT